MGFAELALNFEPTKLRILASWSEAGNLIKCMDQFSLEFLICLLGTNLESWNLIRPTFIGFVNSCDSGWVWLDTSLAFSATNKIWEWIHWTFSNLQFYSQKSTRPIGLTGKATFWPVGMEMMVIFAKNKISIKAMKKVWAMSGKSWQRRQHFDQLVRSGSAFASGPRGSSCTQEDKIGFENAVGKIWNNWSHCLGSAVKRGKQYSSLCCTNR